MCIKDNSTGFSMYSGFRLNEQVTGQQVLEYQL